MGYSLEKSKAWYERAAAVLVEGSSSPSRGPAVYGSSPVFLQSGAGSHIRDIDGNEYIDWMMAYGALPLGHAHPKVVAAVQEATQTGTLFAATTEIEVEVAERLCSLIPGAEKIRFANTGTEAAMAALRLARGYTGRQKFIKFEGHYHGWHDDFLLSSHPHPLVSLGHKRDPIPIPDSSGLNRASLSDTIVVPWNDGQALQRALENHPGQIAAVFSEGIMANMGVIPPRDDFLLKVRELTQNAGALFVLDETVTGFRVAAGGCQELYSVDADIVIFGKALGSGFPVAAFAGQSKIMDALRWGGVLHYGTQNASRVGLFAARASLDELTADSGALFRHKARIAALLQEGLESLFRHYRIPAIVQRVGPMFQIFFSEAEAIWDYRDFCQKVDRERYQRMVWKLFREGVYMSPSAALHSVACAAHSEEDVQQTLAAFERVLSDEC